MFPNRQRGCAGIYDVSSAFIDAQYSQVYTPDDCALREFDADNFDAQMQGRRLLFLGDSLMRGNWGSLACLLRDQVRCHPRLQPSAHLGWYIQCRSALPVSRVSQLAPGLHDATLPKARTFLSKCNSIYWPVSGASGNVGDRGQLRKQAPATLLDIMFTGRCVLADCKWVL